MRVSIINGPNLNLLGTRQPEVYGSSSLADIESMIKGWATRMNIDVDFFQSNDESSLVEAIQKGDSFDGVIINPGGFTHTSVALADAVSSIATPVVEVHLSNIWEREEFRRTSLIEPESVRQIMGRGATSYRDALRHLKLRAISPAEPMRYGSHDRNVADVRRVANVRADVVLVHGGYWYPGWDRDQMDAIAVDLANRGFNTFNLEYRVDPPWPGSGHDIETALAAVGRERPLVVLGHSAGAYLALWAQHRNPADLCVVLAPVADLALVDDVQPVEAMKKAGAPTHLSADSRTLVFHGKDDNEVSPEHSYRLGSEVQLLKGVGHFDIINPERPHWTQVVTAIEAVAVPI